MILPFFVTIKTNIIIIVVIDRFRNDVKTHKTLLHGIKHINLVKHYIIVLWYQKCCHFYWITSYKYYLFIPFCVIHAFSNLLQSIRIYLTSQEGNRMQLNMLRCTLRCWRNLFHLPSTFTDTNPISKNCNNLGTELCCEYNFMEQKKIRFGI